jgi:hypothetical protein
MQQLRGKGLNRFLPELECIDLPGRGCRSAGVSGFGSASRRPLMASVGTLEASWSK